MTNIENNRSDIEKKANFVANSRTWKYQTGGITPISVTFQQEYPNGMDILNKNKLLRLFNWYERERLRVGNAFTPEKASLWATKGATQHIDSAFILPTVTVTASRTPRKVEESFIPRLQTLRSTSTTPSNDYAMNFASEFGDTFLAGWKKGELDKSADRVNIGNFYDLFDKSLSGHSKINITDSNGKIVTLYKTGDWKPTTYLTAEELKTQEKPFMVDDYYYRLHKYMPGVSKKQLEDAYNSAKVNFSVGSSRGVFGKNWDNETQKFGDEAITFNENYLPYRNPIFAHEMTHKYQDTDIYGMYPTNLSLTNTESLPQEKKELLDSYIGEFPADFGGDNNKDYIERMAVNTELRRAISEANNGVLGEELDKIIDNLSEEDIYNLIQNNESYIKGISYLDYSDYNKGLLDYLKANIPSINKGTDAVLSEIEHTLSNKDVFSHSHIPEKMLEYLQAQLDNPRWADFYDFSRNIQDNKEWVKNLMQSMQNYLSITPYKRKLEKDKLRDIRKALKEVAQNTQSFDQGNGIYLAAKGGNIHTIPSKQSAFTKNTNLMNYIDILKNGSGIHIKKANRGKFTDYCGGKVTSECISRGKHSSDPAVRKRATFAANARKWKHQNGGLLTAIPIINYLLVLLP